MRKIHSLAAVLLGLSLFLSACNSATPEKYFEEAVLNTNILHTFGSQGALSDLAPPSLKLVPGGNNQTAPMTRAEIVQNQINLVEANLTKIKALPDSDETRDMVQTSIKLHELALTAYKGEYVELARLFDTGASESERQNKAREIDTKYLGGFRTTYAHLIELGKAYASKHNIKVQWDVSTQPT
jgi:hypothetical protein